LILLKKNGLFDSPASSASVKPQNSGKKLHVFWSCSFFALWGGYALA
jgi:hypothetical protein